MKNIDEIMSYKTEDTERVGADLARKIIKDPKLPRFVALYGDLGVGKTAFVRGFTSEISEKALVRSPTFALVNEYRGDKHDISVFHFDMYRISDEDDLYSIGFYDYPNRNGICLTEWSENIPYALPDRYFKVTIEKNSIDCPDQRRIKTELITELDR